MSEMAKKARAAMKEKAQGRTAPNKGSIDASGWSEPTMNTEAKVGMRPISRRAFKKGGKVEGEAGMKHAGKKPRKAAGGGMSDFAAMADAGKAAAREAKVRQIIDEANAPRPMPRLNRITSPGDDNLTRADDPMIYSNPDAMRKMEGRKTGGRTKRASGGKALTANSLINRNAKEANEERGYPHTGGYKKGGKVHEDAAMDKKLIKAEMAKHEKGCRCEKCMGGRMGKADGGETSNKRMKTYRVLVHNGYEYEPSRTVQGVSRSDAASRWQDKAAPSESRKFKIGGIEDPDAKARGGSAGNYEGGTRPTGGRMARKSGGRTKGKTNIHINIVAGEKHPEGMAPPMGIPGPLPRPPMPVAPPPMAGGAGMPPMGPPPGPMGGGLPPGLGVPPPAMGPMARKSGGRAGHGVYRSYKDMDAGAGGGLGRLEKTEIQKNKG